MRRAEDNLELAAEQTTIDQVGTSHDHLFSIAEVLLDFSDNGGTHNDNHGGGLRHLLKDFATEALTEQHHDLKESVFISAHVLCRYLDDAEQAASIG
jgi:hypothetical protein